MREWEIVKCLNLCSSTEFRYSIFTIAFYCSTFVWLWVHLLLMRVSTLVYFLPFLSPESSESRKIRKNMTWVLGIVVLLESQRRHWLCLGICYSFCTVRVQKPSSLSPGLPSTYAAVLHVPEHPGHIPVTVLILLCHHHLDYSVDNRCSKIDWE